MWQQQSSERQEVGSVPHAELVVVEEPKATPVGSYYKLFIGANPPKFNDREGRTRQSPSWLVEIEKVFDVIELPNRLKVRYSTYSW